jgi:hypothetical protein
LLSNYPPGGGFGIVAVGDAPQFCINRHHWQARMFSELGGLFYARDDDSACPRCEAEDIRNSFPETLTPEERLVQEQLLSEEEPTNDNPDSA